MGGEGQKQALVRHEMLHHSRQKAGLRGRLADLPEVDPRQRGETLQLVLVTGEEGESLDGDGLGGGGRGYRAT